MDVLVRSTSSMICARRQHLPMTDKVMIDREQITNCSTDAATIPEEIKQARWIVKERQEMLQEAKEESERIIAEAREEGARLTSEQEVVKRAEREAEDIIRDAEARARSVWAPKTTPMRCWPRSRPTSTSSWQPFSGRHACRVGARTPLSQLCATTEVRIGQAVHQH